MYICLDCGRTFENPYYIGTDFDAGNEPVFVCPCCHRLRYREAVWCTHCESWKDPESERVHEGICESCLNKLYSSYLAVNVLTDRTLIRKDFMRWLGVPLVLESEFVEVLRNIYRAKWAEEDRIAFLKNAREYFMDDLYYFSTQIVTPMLTRYDYGAFAIEFCAKKFFSFLRQKWDPFCKEAIHFTAFFYKVKDATQETADALMHYIQSQFDEAERGNITAQKELNRIVSAMTDFSEENRYVQLAYCNYCECHHE